VTEQDARTAPKLDPLPDVGIPPMATQAMLDLKMANSVQRPGPGADAQAIAEWYRGQREAEADLYARIEAKARSGNHSVSAAAAHELTLYAFHRAVEAHTKAVAETDPVQRARLFGARNAYAISYGELALRDVEHMDAPDIADRIIESLDSGVTDTELLVLAGWDADFPILLDPPKE
jgi:hypothetical protein